MSQPSSPKPSRTEGKQERHARILRAAMELFVDRGFAHASISAIAARAGVSRGTVFWHFGNKEGLFREACKQFFVPFWKEFEKSLDDLEPRKRAFELFSGYEDFVSANRVTVEAFLSWVLSDAPFRESFRGELLGLHQMFAGDLQQAIGGALGDPAEAEALTTGLISLLAGNLLLGLIDPSPQLEERLRDGLRAVAGRVLPLGPGRPGSQGEK